jgi:DNA-binding NarL/FixJ family response regulator
LQDGLQSAALDTLGLAGAIDMLADHIQRMRGVRVALSIARINLEASTEMALIRAVQGVLDRALRAGATRITLTLDDKRETLMLTISDDGLPLADDDQLRIARLHAASAGAELRARAGNPRGTTVEIRLVQAQAITLTEREMQVLRLLVDGQSNPEIAGALHVTVRTVKYHLDNLYSKLGARSRTDAVAIAVRRGLVGGPPLP